MQKEGDRCTLRISEAFPEDEGVYKCIAQNPAGEVTTSANLRVLGKPTKPLSFKLSLRNNRKYYNFGRAVQNFVKFSKHATRKIKFE